MSMEMTHHYSSAHRELQTLQPQLCVPLGTKANIGTLQDSRQADAECVAVCVYGSYSMFLHAGELFSQNLSPFPSPLFKQCLISTF